MSLQTDIVFYNAIKSDDDLMEMISNRVFNTVDEDGGEWGENTDIPYIIIRNMGGQNDQSTKDGYEGDTDTINISLEIAANSREELANITQKLREVVNGYFCNADVSDDDYELIPQDYQLSFSSVEYDWSKPCYWQILSYQCDTNV